MIDFKTTTDQTKKGWRPQSADWEIPQTNETNKKTTIKRLAYSQVQSSPVTVETATMVPQKRESRCIRISQSLSQFGMARPDTVNQNQSYQPTNQLGNKSCCNRTSTFNPEI